LIYYVLGGDPILAKEFAKMLMHYKHEYEIKEANQGYIVVPYPYTDIINTTILGAHHNMTDNEDGAIKLDVKTTLQLMTGSAKFDWEEVVNKPFVKTYWDEIVKLASVEGSKFADMFQLKEDGKYLIMFVLTCLVRYSHYILQYKPRLVCSSLTRVHGMARTSQGY